MVAILFRDRVQHLSRFHRLVLPPLRLLQDRVLLRNGHMFLGVVDGFLRCVDSFGHASEGAERFASLWPSEFLSGFRTKSLARFPVNLRRRLSQLGEVAAPLVSGEVFALKVLFQFDDAPIVVSEGLPPADRYTPLSPAR